MCVCVCVCVCVCAPVCVCVCVCVCACVCVCVCLFLINTGSFLLGHLALAGFSGHNKATNSFYLIFSSRVRQLCCHTHIHTERQTHTHKQKYNHTIHRRTLTQTYTKVSISLLHYFTPSGSFSSLLCGSLFLSSSVLPVFNLVCPSKFSNLSLNN